MYKYLVLGMLLIGGNAVVAQEAQTKQAEVAVEKEQTKVMHFSALPDTELAQIGLTRKQAIELDTCLQEFNDLMMNLSEKYKAECSKFASFEELYDFFKKKEPKIALLEAKINVFLEIMEKAAEKALNNVAVS